jgi:hypothetical protein
LEGELRTGESGCEERNDREEQIIESRDVQVDWTDHGVRLLVSR